MHFLSEYGLFLAKITTFVVAIIVVISFIVAATSKDKDTKLKIKKINKKYEEFKESLNREILTKSEFKKLSKEIKKSKKTKKAQSDTSRRKIYVINFHGDIKASATHSLSEEVTAILTVAKPQDEVVVRLESGGGIVPYYGLAASQLQRLRDGHIPLTITIDRIAASGGYMMACVASKILAAPFSIVGSIGVLAQLPNFHHLLKKNDIDYEQIMSGEYKRTLSLFGENTEKGRKKIQEEVDNTHKLFKAFISAHRPQVNINEVATGEYWHGEEALKLQLVDTLMTSDDYLLSASKEADIFEIQYVPKKSLASRLSLSFQSALTHLTGLGNKYQRILM